MNMHGARYRNALWHIFNKGEITIYLPSVGISMEVDIRIAHTTPVKADAEDGRINRGGTVSRLK
jgi:hypothetical protein